MTVEELLEEIEIGVADAKADWPSASEADIIREIAHCILEGHSPPWPVSREVYRRLGLYPA